ncbi:MAG: GlsB/YeaQ/YmgE family stress response membrane protein [Chloroflexota bacterium]|nr:GlsB/YeaQ/YmgE family stress response membrane protein [Chloroflexota bacterium]
MGCFGFIVMLVMLLVIGWVIDLIVPGRMPYGWLGGVGAAIVGGILGGFLFSGLSVGPWAEIGTTRLYFVPALLGGIVLGFIVRFVMGSQSRPRL